MNIKQAMSVATANLNKLAERVEEKAREIVEGFGLPDSVGPSMPAYSVDEGIDRVKEACQTLAIAARMATDRLGDPVEVQVDAQEEAEVDGDEESGTSQGIQVHDEDAPRFATRNGTPTPFVGTPGPESKSHHSSNGKSKHSKKK